MDMKKEFALTTLDKRHKAYGKFKFFVSVPFVYSPKVSDRNEIFCNWRVWCWNTWGPSCELDFYDASKDYFNKKWCWEVSEFNLRIYLLDDETATAFTFNWL